MNCCTPRAAYCLGAALYYVRFLLKFLFSGETCAESDIPTPVNGRKTPDQIFHYGLNATVTFTCNTGFGLVGSTLASCASGGMWTNAAPVCKRKSPPLKKHVPVHRCISQSGSVSSGHSTLIASCDLFCSCRLEISKYSSHI